MEYVNFKRDLPAIWLVFADSFLNHENAPKNSPDCREKSLVDLLYIYLRFNLQNCYTRLNASTLSQVDNICKLLKTWSEDLGFIYKIRENHNKSGIDELVQRIFQRIQNLENCSLIPNGLICANHFKGHENVCLAIIKKHNVYIDWIQVDPGSGYHQNSPDLITNKSNSYLSIKNIDPNNISEDWLNLLVNLKTVIPDQYYTNKSLYECLLSHLNGETVFQSEPDQGFITYSHTSPVHTWNVIDQSFQYLIQHFVPDIGFEVYCILSIGFKLFLIEKTLYFYQSGLLKKNDIQECHFLLQEMCRNIAQQTLKQGNSEQKNQALELINSVKAAIKQSCRLQEKNIFRSSQLNAANVLSLNFVKPNIINYVHSSSDLSFPDLKVDPLVVKPKLNDDIIEYLNNFQSSFIEKLINCNSVGQLSLLSYGIEVFFIDYLANTNILQKSATSPFSKDDLLLATNLISIAKIYFGCQGQLVNSLSELTYQPQFYAKNVIIQFFVYAAIAALNLRDRSIGPLLSLYNLSININESITLNKIIPYLVIDDRKWLNVLFSVETFFMAKESTKTLFSHKRYQSDQFIFDISNNQINCDTDTAFAYHLLQKNLEAYTRFEAKYLDLEDEKLNRKWRDLIYSESYLPPLYFLLYTVAHIAKVSLTGFPSNKNKNNLHFHWTLDNSPDWACRARFRLDRVFLDTNFVSNKLCSYLLYSDGQYGENPYQRFVTKSGRHNLGNHFSENEIISSQNKKPDTMDCVRYMKLGFLQSEPLLKLQRLYIAVKDQQIDFTCEQECILIKQTLFEVSEIQRKNNKVNSLLEKTAEKNPDLIHKFGILCVEKAQAMQHRLTQHHAIGNILEVILSLLTFYPSVHKTDLLKGIKNIYYLLKNIIENSHEHLSDNTLLHLNVYLIMSVQVNSQSLETDLLIILNALVSIQNYKIQEIKLDNRWLRQLNVSCINLSSKIKIFLNKDLSVLNKLMLKVNPLWDSNSIWQKNQTSLLYTCDDHSIVPLAGTIYYKNQPLTGLPDDITEHSVFKEYLNKVNFVVMPNSYNIGSQKVPCYLSYNYEPQMRFTLLEKDLLIEEFIDNDYQRYIPISIFEEYSCMIYQLPYNKNSLRHWLHKNNSILIKDQQRRIIYKWNLTDSKIFSLEQNGYVVPWEKLKKARFKSWLERVESSDWIELIANENLNIIHIQALNFVCLGLHFDYVEGKFRSKQIHGYTLAKQQHINTLHGFCNYLVLEKKEPNSIFRRVKIVIPHRELEIDANLYLKDVETFREGYKSPTYFVYDRDPITGLLKAHHIRAQLYLALLYYSLASFDDYDLSNCNSYHLARENLEICWKDQPYNSTELNIIEQFIKLEAMFDLHSHRIAIYLKVISLLISSLRLAFLYTDKTTNHNVKKSEELLKRADKNLSELLKIYLMNKYTIFSRIRLSEEEEKDIINRCKNKFEFYYHLYHENQPQLILSSKTQKFYKGHYGTFFDKDALTNTEFINIFKKHLVLFSVSCQNSELDFSSGIHKIDLFRLKYFIPLYKLAKSSTINILRYQYLLHHMVLSAKMNEETFPSDLTEMLARALLLVAENPSEFPESPYWFGEQVSSVEIFKSDLNELKVISSLPTFEWTHSDDYYSLEEERKAMQKAKEEFNIQNRNIWILFNKFDLDSQRKPKYLPRNPYNFTLSYESQINGVDIDKLIAVRNLYLQTAYNDAMYKFFVSLLNQCDELKYDSNMGWDIAPFIPKTISVTFEKIETETLPQSKSRDLTKWYVPQEPLIVLENFISIDPKKSNNKKFLFDQQLEEPDNGYQEKFFKELKSSWVTYHNETEYVYSWLDQESVNSLEKCLQKQYKKIHNQAGLIWKDIIGKFEEKPNSEMDNYFALRWHSGEVCHYHKGDILASIVEQHKIMLYNPNFCKNQDGLTQDLLHYINCEINSAKIVRVLALINEYKSVKCESEQFSILQSIVSSLEESLDPSSYLYSHWILFQLENEMIVRDNQRELMNSMLNQTEKAMYQLNMGEGKTSVILPLLSYSLADGQKLLRIIILPSLMITMKDFLRQRFSGLIKTRIYTLPFYRDTDISSENLNLIFETLDTCQRNHYILLITPEHRLCLQLKIRELMLEKQQQIGATNIFNWDTYRQRVHHRNDLYMDLTEEETERILAKQDQELKKCLCKEKFLDSNNKMLKVPPRGLGRIAFAHFKEMIHDTEFREWSCLKAAYRELLFNSKLAYEDCSKKLALLNKIFSLNAIDLLDESDEILRHGTELNYSVGDKYVFAGGELRWQIPQFFIKAIFCDPELIEIIKLGKQDGFTVINEHFSVCGGVPFIQLLNESYYESSIKPVLIEKFFTENISTLRKYNVAADDNLIDDETSSLRHFVAGQLPLNVEKNVMTFLTNKGALKDKILIAKGWLTHGILYHVFNAKYRVQYGLNLHIKQQTPKQIAIPFWGKDSPSPRSEFSHPDVMLGFTIISYLYEGLDQNQLKEALLKLKDKFSTHLADKHLKDWTQASKNWIESQTTEFPPIILASHSYLDLANEQCLLKVHTYLSGNYLAIFFYLDQFVLIEEAMQYRFKISANAHSLISYNAALGFSGTDDRKITMPFQVKSLCSVSQEGTNGKLLSVLTQERNSRYYSLKSEAIEDLLKELCSYVKKQENCHALIDAGALITGLTNYEVALFLLNNLPSSFLGILYFSDEGNNLSVLTRDKKIMSLQDCYLDKKYLFAYLDDIHTRGTDIKLPLNSHAILTISIGMQKDKLMQAAMRLRQLAQKQSVSLWGTQAVTLAISRDHSINQSEINSLEVLKWVTKNTIDHINGDLFAVTLRKINFQFLKQAEMWLKEAPTTLDSLIKYCQEAEKFLLEEFYAATPQYEDLADRLFSLVSIRIKVFWQELEQECKKKNITDTAFYKKIFHPNGKMLFRKQLYAVCEETAIYLQSGFVQTSLDDDEEKEVEIEIIQEQEVLTIIEKRNPCTENGWNFRLITNKNFIKLALKESIIMPLENVKKFVQEPANIKNIIWNPNIYMTRNYIESVKSSPAESLDNYLRPVDVILFHRAQDLGSKAILLSGYEAAQIKYFYPENLNNNFLLHINDVNGPTKFPKNYNLSKEEEKLLTIIKLFSGECHYGEMKEVERIAKRVGRLYPHYFTCIEICIDDQYSKALFDILIKNRYLDFAGVMTEKLLKILEQVNSGEFRTLELTNKYQANNPYLLKKLLNIYKKLIIQPTSSLKDGHITLWQWIGTRGRLKEYTGSALESILNSEFQFKCSL